MGQCKHHPQLTADGVCPTCLQKKLKSVRWGAESKQSIDPVHPKEAIAILGSIASIKKRNHKASGRGHIMESGLDFVLDSRYGDVVTTPSRSMLLCPPSKVLDQSSTDRKRWLGTSKTNKTVGKSLVSSIPDSPLVDKIAKETALRVIREVKDDMSVEDDVVVVKEKRASSPFSPSRWRSKLGLKGIGSPMNLTSSNKVFPSKSMSPFSPARDHQSRLMADQQAGDRIIIKPAERKVANEDAVIVGMPDRILKPEDMNQRLRTSYNTVLQWLQDLPVPETMKTGDGDQDPYTTMEMRSSDAGLTVVGHLHEIAEEEQEMNDESSVEEAPPAPTPTANHMDEVSSFGKFLIRAAQRQPKQGLSRVQARASAA